MATPRNRLRAHQGGPDRRPGQKRADPGLEGIGLHVIGEPPEAGVSPPPIGRIGADALSEPSQRGVMKVVDLPAGEKTLQILFVEMGHPPRLRHGPDIDQKLDPVMMEQIQKQLERPGRVTDGIKRISSRRFESTHAVYPFPALG